MRRGRFVRKIGSEGSGHRQFNGPCGVALDDHVYVSEHSNHRVQVLTKEGVFVRMIGGGRGSEPGQLRGPCGVAMGEEHLFVCDYGNRRVQIFNKADGVHVREVWGCSADGLQALRPYIHLQGERIYVTADVNMNVISDSSSRVVVFRG